MQGGLLFLIGWSEKISLIGKLEQRPEEGEGMRMKNIYREESSRWRRGRSRQELSIFKEKQED